MDEVMDPPGRPRLRERLSLPRADEIALVSSGDRLPAIKVGLLFYGTASLLGILGHLVSLGADEQAVEPFVATALALILASVFLVVYERITTLGLHLLLVGGTATICLSLSGDNLGAANATHMFLLIICLYAFAFFELRAAFAHLAFVAAGLTLVFFIGEPVPDPSAMWVLLVGTFTVCGLAIHVLLRRLMHLHAREARLARIDELTGLPNRRAFLESGNRDLERARRDHAHAALLLVDLDHFKALNDQAGHAAGDRALQIVASTLRGQVRAGELVARWGGEEFTVLVTPADRAGARECAERLRAAVARATASDGRALTASVGVAIAPADIAIEILLERADAALYEAKDAGRDRTHVVEAANA